MKMAVFWGTEPCSLVNVYLHLRSIVVLHGASALKKKTVILIYDQLSTRYEMRTDYYSIRYFEVPYVKKQPIVCVSVIVV